MSERDDRQYAKEHEWAVIEKVTDKCDLLSAAEYDAYIDSLS